MEALQGTLKEGQLCYKEKPQTDADLGAQTQQEGLG